MPQNANPTTDSAAAVDAAAPEAETTPETATESSSEGQTKPKAGKVTADETKRSLSDVVVAHSLSRVGDKIAEVVKDIKPGGILIVDDLSWAVNDIFYLDLRKKLDKLLQWSKKMAKDCQDFLDQHEETTTYLIVTLDRREREGVGAFNVKDDEPSGSQPVPGIMALLALAAPGLAAPVAGIGAGLQSVGDIIGYFRSDYAIKGQVLANVDDLYIQAMLAEDLLRKGQHVYLLNFNFIQQSALLDTLGELLEQKNNMVAATEKINSEFVGGIQARIDALGAHLASLKTKLIEYLVKVDEDIIQTLRNEIHTVENRLQVAQEQRTPDTQITALEAHLSSLRTKLVDELIEDTPAAIAAVRTEIDKIIEKLEKKDVPDQKLTEVAVQALRDQLKLLQAKLTDLVAAARNNTTALLKKEITKVSDLLKADQRTRLPDSQINSMEAHLTSLRTELEKSLVRNDNDAKASLEKEIVITLREIDRLQKHIGEASGIVNQANKVNAAIDAFLSTITTVPTGGGYPPLVAACVREHLTEDKIRYILKIKLVSSGADFITEEPPFYSRVVKNSYIGGGVVSYVMADREGQMVASGTVPGAAALEHQFGKEPQLIDWKIRKQRTSTGDKMASPFLNLLITSSVLYIMLALLGAVLAVGENLADAAGSSSVSAVQAFLWMGTVLSPPLYQLIMQAVFTGLALFRQDWWRTFGVISLAFLGLLFGSRMLAEATLSKMFSSDPMNVFQLVVASLIVVPFMMMALGIQELTGRDAEK